MDEMKDRSIRKMLLVNRNKFANNNKFIPRGPSNYVGGNYPEVDPPVPPQPPLPTSGYVASDFGDNAVNNHQYTDGGHSERCQVIFNYITKNFRNRCTSFQTYNNTFLGNGLLTPSTMLSKLSAIDADIVYTPYVNAAYWTNGEYLDFVLAVGSHHSNAGSDGDITNSNRVDITANAETLLPNSVAVSAQRDIYELLGTETSYGYGMEFFEDCSPEALDPVYPVKDVPIAFAEVRTSEDGYVLYGNRVMDMNTNPHLSVGDEITLVNGGLSEVRVISAILENGTIRVTQPFTPFVVIGFITLKTMIDGVETKIAEVGTESNGMKLRAFNIKGTDFNNTLSVGKEVKLIYPDEHVETKTISKVDRYDFVTLTSSATQYQVPGIYVWYKDTIGRYVGGQAQSWAVPLVAGKLKVIKMTTGADWPTVRAAARATAKRNPTGVPEIDNANWDIYRGFGCIQVQDAIDYINSNT